MKARIFPPQDAVNQLMQQLKKHGLKPNSETYVELLQGVGDARHLDSIDKLVEEALQEKLFNISVARAAIQALKKCGRGKEALDLLHKLDDSERSPEKFIEDIQNSENPLEVLRMYSSLLEILKYSFVSFLEDSIYTSTLHSFILFFIGIKILLVFFLFLENF